MYVEVADFHVLLGLYIYQSLISGRSRKATVCITFDRPLRHYHPWLKNTDTDAFNGTSCLSFSIHQHPYFVFANSEGEDESAYMYILVLGYQYLMCNRNSLGRFRDIPWNQTTEIHRGSALITRVITWHWRYITWRWRHRNHVNTITSVIAAKQTVMFFNRISLYTGGNVVRGNQTVMQMKSLRDHPDMSYGSNKQWNQLCE